MRRIASFVSIAVFGNLFAGVFAASNETPAQRGSELYALHCARCHGDSLSGSYEIPSLSGGFVARWAGAPRDRLVDYVYRAMPLQQPGALSDREADDIVAFILESNHLAARNKDISILP
jgi:cytochrome c